MKATRIPVSSDDMDTDTYADAARGHQESHDDHHQESHHDHHQEKHQESHHDKKQESHKEKQQRKQEKDQGDTPATASQHRRHHRSSSESHASPPPPPASPQHKDADSPEPQERQHQETHQETQQETHPKETHQETHQETHRRSLPNGGGDSPAPYLVAQTSRPVASHFTHDDQQQHHQDEDPRLSNLAAVSAAWRIAASAASLVAAPVRAVANAAKGAARFSLLAARGICVRIAPATAAPVDAACDAALAAIDRPTHAFAAAASIAANAARHPRKTAAEFLPAPFAALADRALAAAESLVPAALLRNFH